MTTLDFTGGFRTQPVWQGLVGALVAGWQNFGGAVSSVAIAAIARLAPHVIRVFGFDPERLHDVLDGTWDEVKPVAFRRVLPRDRRV
jgi:hypothetical protein